ncbi:hypothetical protein D3C74_432810 [compost metagenome]
MEQCRNGVGAVHQQPFQGFRGNLQHARGILHQLRLVCLGHISMPMPDRYIPFTQQVIQTGELVIDQRLKRRYVENAY